MRYDIDGNLVCGEAYNIDHTDAECTEAFLTYMAEKCANYGMSGTLYANPSGLTMDSYSTPRDALKLGTVVASSPRAMDIWATTSRDFKVKGPNARTISVTNNVLAGVGATLTEAGYNFLGGKGGSLNGSGYRRAAIYMVDLVGQLVMLSLLVTGQTAYNNIDLCVKELCDKMVAEMTGGSAPSTPNLSAAVTAGGGYAACIIPPNAGAYQNLETPAELLARSHSLNAAPTVSLQPASTTKTMTMMAALDFVEHLHMPVTVKTSDISSGSGSTFYNGDELTFYDAVRIMMAESSNTLANTIARTVGGMILAYQE